jgi:hypothetical protein
MPPRVQFADRPKFATRASAASATCARCSCCSADDGIVANKLAKVMGHEDIATTMHLYVWRTEDHDAIRDLLDWRCRFIGMLPIRCLMAP